MFHKVFNRFKWVSLCTFLPAMFVNRIGWLIKTILTCSLKLIIKILNLYRNFIEKATSGILNLYEADHQRQQARFGEFV